MFMCVFKDEDPMRWKRSYHHLLPCIIKFGCSGNTFSAMFFASHTFGLAGLRFLQAFSRRVPDWPLFLVLHAFYIYSSRLHFNERSVYETVFPNILGIRSYHEISSSCVELIGFTCSTLLGNKACSFVLDSWKVEHPSGDCTMRQHKISLSSEYCTELSRRGTLE